MTLPPLLFSPLSVFWVPHRNPASHCLMASDISTVTGRVESFFRSLLQNLFFPLPSFNLKNITRAFQKEFSLSFREENERQVWLVRKSHNDSEAFAPLCLSRTGGAGHTFKKWIRRWLFPQLKAISLWEIYISSTVPHITGRLGDGEAQGGDPRPSFKHHTVISRRERWFRSWNPTVQKWVSRIFSPAYNGTGLLLERESLL